MKIHFLGIGGIGVSALAQYYLAKGHQVSGFDLVRSEITELLEKKGAKLLKKIPQGVDLIIYSPAVKQLPEIKGAKLLSYPQALGELTKKYFTVAVSGTHGKSTTTAMLSLILIKAGLDPTVVVGTKLKEFGSTNFRPGKSRYLVIEADEWQASFLNYWPKIIVLTNIEREHLDYYRDLSHILETYKKYIAHLPKRGILVANGDDNNIRKMSNPKPQIPNPKQISNPKFQTKFYSFHQPEFKKLKEILKIPGEHNIYNALAALAAARVLKIPDKISFQALSEYKGAWRRFEIKTVKIGNKKFKIVNDYGHHPTEVKAALQAAREKFGRKKIWCVFQPHQHQRTFYLFKKFVKVFREAAIDRLIITDIYDVVGREKGEIKKKINSKKLVETINKKSAIYLPKEKIKNYLRKNLKGGEALFVMGAGDIYKLL